MNRPEAELLLPRPELLRTTTIGQNAASLPQNIVARRVKPNFFRHLLHNFVKERVGIDEHEPSLLANQRADEITSGAHTDQSLIGIDDVHAVPDPVREEFEVVISHAAADVSVRAEELLNQDRMESHRGDSIDFEEMYQI